MIELKFLEKSGIAVLGKDASGRTLLKASGGDPQFDVVAGDGSVIAAGWYELLMDLTVSSRRPVDPVFYPDYGTGMHESSRIPVILERGGESIHSTVVVFRGQVCRLRFDPSIGPCEFSLGRCYLRKISRLRAAHLMLGHVYAEQDGKRARYGFIAHMLGKLGSGGVSGFAAALRAIYEKSALHGEADYDAWVALYGALTRPQPGEIDGWTHRPTFSVVVPVYNPPERWLRRCLDSVIEQSYPYWELCISDDCSPQPHVRRVLEEYRQKEPRLKVVYRDKNGHISASSNSALELASNDFVALLDHDDELHPHALYEMARAIVKHPRWRMAFSDEDKIDDKGRRFDPYFKADWNYDLFLSHNCISHLGVYQRELIREVGGFREHYEGSQDWDLALRCIERLAPDQIGHVPHVLYHWRAIPGSTALAPGEKSYAHVAAIKSIQSHLDRVGRKAEVLELPRFSGNYRVRNRLPDPVPKVSLIMPTRDRADLLRVAIGSILEKTDYPDYEIIVVDNQSSEPATFEFFNVISKDDRIRVISYDQPFNYSGINNLAVSQAAGSIVGLVNNDIEVISPSWLTEMASQAVRSDIGAVGAMLYFPDETIQHAGVILGFNGVAVHAFADRPRGWVGMMLRAQLLQNYSAVTAACLLVRKSVYLEVGGLDERLSVAYNDIDFCLRLIEAGYRNLWTPYAELYHHESASRGNDMDPGKRERFESEVALMNSRWSNFMNGDPAYNKNLASTGQTFDLSFPPRYGWSQIDGVTTGERASA